MKLKHFFKLSIVQHGFTLIELLVVIGILGILAAALIATIDPFEQLKKANDAASRAAASEFVDAVTRYYGNTGAFPWDATSATPPGDGCTPAPATSGTAGTQLSGMTGTGGCITVLQTKGELKSGFGNSNSLKNIYVSGGTTTQPFTACYAPTSKIGKADLNTKYNAVGTVTAGCPGATSCYYCLQ